MSFNYNSSTWTPRTTSEHAVDLLNNINAALAANNVQVNGKLVQFAAVITNVIWILCLAVGAMRSLYDNVLLAASKMFSVSECSDAQMLAVLPLTGTQLLSGSYSLVTIQVTADSGGDAVVPTNTLLPNGVICNFKVLTGATVPAGTTVDFLCQSDVIGPIAAAAHSITAFTSTIAHVLTVDNGQAAVLGSDPETVLQLRQRLLEGNIADIGVDGTVRALRSIQGITAAALYFNYDTVNNLLIPGGIVVPPRYSYMVLQGLDLSGTEVALAYARRMTAPTIGGHTQYFVTQAGQSFPVNFDYAAGQTVYITVYYDGNSIAASGFDSSIRQILLGLVPGVGQSITAAYILQALTGFPYALITGASVSLDGLTWSNEAVIYANRIATFSASYITVAVQP